MVAQLKHLELFVKFAAKELGLKTLPHIKFVGHSEDSKSAFGHSIGNKITIRIVDRHPIDVMRTIAHELIHYRQNVKKVGGDRFREDSANALAGRIMRKFDVTYPQIFKDKSIKANMMEDGMTTSGLAANHIGSSSSTAGTGGIDMIDPLLPALKAPLKRKLLQPLQNNLNNYSNTIKNQPKKLRDIIGRDFRNEKRSDKR